MDNSEKGFQLLELLTTLAIVSILIALSLPLYSQYLVQAKRLQAKSTLTRLALAMEKFHIEHDTYNGATLTTLNFRDANTEKNYRLKIEANNNAYTLIAEATGKQAENDKECAGLMLSLNNKGQTSECW